MGGMLGDILIERGQITDGQLSVALETKTPGQMLGDRMLEMGMVTEKQLGSALSQQFDVPYVDVDPQQVNLQVVRLLPESFQRRRQVLPLRVTRRRMELAMVSPDDIEAISEAEMITGYRIDASITFAHNVADSLTRAFDERSLARQTIVDVKIEELQSEDTTDPTEMELAVSADAEAPVVKLVQAILGGAADAGCSDIHLEPHKPEMRVRYRVDGELQQVMTIPSHIEESVVARIKVMADMNTTENRRPQDGQLRIENNGSGINFRVSSIPTVGGEKVVLRLLDEGSKSFSLDDLGLSTFNRNRVQSALDKPHGMFVVTGPTGSGKSTTLYAALSALNEVRRNIVTVEDPVEYQVAGINQVQSDNEFGMGFANALKFIMRQDPDVIMLGEIRDHETASTAVQAALTGHLLLSTLHTNDAVGAITRLTDLGVDAFKIGGSLLGSIAQRLLRTICEDCKEEVEGNAVLIERLSPHCEIPPDARFYAGKGCRKCLGCGYRGRTPIFEIMIVNAEMADAISAGLPASKISELALRDGMVPLLQSGVDKAIAGLTTLDEVYYKTLG